LSKTQPRQPRFYQKACDGSRDVGCYNLGGLYLEGTGVVQDVAKAASLYQKACDGGMMSGCYNLGVLYAQAGGCVATPATAPPRASPDHAARLDLIADGVANSPGATPARARSRAKLARRPA